MKPLLSLLIPSRRPDQLIGLLDSIEKTVFDPSSVEVLVKIDDDMPEALSIIEQEATKRLFSVKYLNTPRLGGVFTLWVGLDDLFGMSDLESYFVMALTDESRFLTPNWDEVLKKYVGFFSDDAFRLRISNSRFVNNPSHFSCCTKPESFPIFTRRWLDLTEGICNLCYGSDSYQQSIVFHLGLGSRSYFDVWQNEARFRDVQVHDISFGGFEFGQDISKNEQLTRSLYMFREWKRINSFKEQRNIAYLSKKITLYCWAVENGNCDFFISKRETDYTVAVVDHATGIALRRVSYNPPRSAIYFKNLWLKISLFPPQFRLFLGQLDFMGTKIFDSYREWGAENISSEKENVILAAIENAGLIFWAPVALAYRVSRRAILKIYLAKPALPYDAEGIKCILHETLERIYCGLIGISKKSEMSEDDLFFARSSGGNFFTHIGQYLSDSAFRRAQRLKLKKAIFFMPVLILFFPYFLARKLIFVCGPVVRFFIVRTGDFLLKPLDWIFDIPPAGLERPQPYNPFSFWYRFRKTRYPTADYDTMKQMRDRQLEVKSEWASRIYDQESPHG